MGVHGGKAWFSLCEKLLEKCGHSLFLRKPNGKLWEKAKSVVSAFSINHQKNSRKSFRADENPCRDIAITSYRTPSSILHKCPQAVAYKIDFGRRKTPPHAVG